MIGLLIACIGAIGVYLVYTSVAFGWSGLGPSARIAKALPQTGRMAWLGQSLGTGEAKMGELFAFCSVLAVVGGALGYALFAGVFPALVMGGFAATVPITSFRVRRRLAVEQAQEAWPRLIDEIRVLSGAAGRTLPQALFDAGLRGPSELRPAFEAAQREWLLSTDFDRTLNVLKLHLADPTADAVCETLLIAHQLGGTDVDARLVDLAQDRLHDTQGRKDARAKQAGARFARIFVLIVPAGMALVGMQLGPGRAAYRTSFGQTAVVAAIAVVGLCWLWAGSIMRLPTESRVLGPTLGTDARPPVPGPRS